ncbi:MAG: LysR family transcriptional regulator [Alphaproteobacteria bacterium]|nr:LysR family transcriptional regulator [Alphaproteobacteria bacterium]MCA0449873.1 LysR family transcriptional regulator [Pseudomonadota bacterium]
MEWLRAAELFVNVVQLGSLSAAARRCGVSPATVSRIIHSLEEDVGGRLLNRTSRKLNLTEAGEFYYGRIDQILHQIQEANDSVARLQANPRGTLRVHSRMLVGNQYIAPALPEFMRRYPEISVDLTLSNYAIDLIAQNVDVDIRIGKLEDSSLVARKLASAHRIVCAAPSYLKNCPPLEKPIDLTNHNCLTYRINLGRPVWRFIDKAGKLLEVPVAGSLQSDNGPALLGATLAGVGVSVMPDWAVKDDLAAGRLVSVLPGYQASHIEFDNGIYAVFQHATQIPSKVRVFVDYIAAHFKERLGEPPRRAEPVMELVAAG